MKVIETRETKDKKTRRNQLLIGLILMALMVFSTLGYALNLENKTTSNDVVTYNGIKFSRNSEYWQFILNGNEFLTRYNSNDTKDINFKSTITLKDYENKPLYFAGDPSEGNLEVARNLQQRFVLRIGNACISQQECKEDYPVKNCSADNIIVFKEIENQTERIYKEDNCIFISASSANQTLYTDRFLFKILGIQ